MERVYNVTAADHEEEYQAFMRLNYIWTLKPPPTLPPPPSALSADEEIDRLLAAAHAKLQETYPFMFPYCPPGYGQRKEEEK